MGSISEIQKGVASLVVEPDGDAFFVLKYANKQEYIWPGREKPATTATATSSPSGTELSEENPPISNTWQFAGPLTPLATTQHQQQRQNQQARLHIDSKSHHND